VRKNEAMGIYNLDKTNLMVTVCFVVFATLLLWCEFCPQRRKESEKIQPVAFFEHSNKQTDCFFLNQILSSPINEAFRRPPTDKILSK